MKLKALAALPLIVAMSAAPVFAGTLGTVVQEPDVIVPIVVAPVGGLSAATIGAAVVGTLIVIALVGGSDDATEETPEAAAVN